MLSLSHLPHQSPYQRHRSPRKAREEVKQRLLPGHSSDRRDHARRSRGEFREGRQVGLLNGPL